MTYLSVMQFFVQGYFSRIAFNREVEKNYKMITMLCSVEGQASCTDEHYLFNRVESMGPAERDMNSIYLKLIIGR